MAGLTPAAQDRFFFLGLGLSACAVIGVVQRMLIHYQHAAVIQPPESKPQYITQEVEDSLKLSTLNKLLESTNHSILETTAAIICERALHDGTTIDVLLYYISRPKHATRERGIRALTKMLHSSYVAALELLAKPKTYVALVKCLEYSITDYEHPEYDLEWDSWHFRDVVEQGCLMILVQMVDKFGVDDLLKARFVERWLVKEPWGSADEDMRQFNFMNYLTKRFRLNDLCLPIFRNSAGKKVLEDAKLLPPSQSYDMDVHMANVESAAGEDFDGMFVDSRRHWEQSSEEEHLRRRHREAMVLNDGSRPLERGDIIEGYH